MGLFAKFKEAWLKPMSFDSLNEGFYDDLEEALILADVGMDTAVDAVAQLKKRAYAKLLTHEEDVKNALRDILTEKLSVGDPALDLSTRPSVALIIGVNGVGKTTSIGKLAHRLKNEGNRGEAFVLPQTAGAAIDQSRPVDPFAGLCGRCYGARPAAAFQFPDGQSVLRILRGFYRLCGGFALLFAGGTVRMSLCVRGGWFMAAPC